MKGYSIDKIKDILTRLINKIILKKYPELTLDYIRDYGFRGYFISKEYTAFDVNFLTPEKLHHTIQRDIHDNILELFKAASLNYDEDVDPNANSVNTFFKTKGEDQFTFIR
jgi:capsule polysaccharide export protein KpsC/LpsZ